MQDLKNLFLLDPAIRHLNHGSFGACPKPIFDNYQHWQLELEKSGVQFVTKKGVELLRASRTALGAFIGCAASDVVFTMNPSYALNIIAKGFPLQPGDEILTTDHEYGALVRTWNYYCRKAGARFVQQKIQLPIRSKEQIIDDFWKGYTPKTKAIFISHITSATALVFPVKEICDRAKELGLFTIVDGAHVPGHIPLDLSQLKADVYAGACHKWLLTPKGSSFLYVAPEWQHLFDPLIISWGFESEHPGESPFIDYHEYQGTRDFSAFLTIPEALAFRENYHWEQVSARCKQMILDNYAHTAEVVGSAPICPVSSEFLGQMCSIPIRTHDPIQLKETLIEEFGIEMPVFVHNGQVYIRYSAQAYVSQQDIDYLNDTLATLVRRNVIK